MTRQCDESVSVEAKFIGRVLRRPPIVDLVFDLALHNKSREPRWFLLPSTLDSFSGSMGQGGANGVEIRELHGAGSRVYIGCFLGKAGFKALLLPGGAEVVLRRFPISLWEEDPVDAVDLEVWVAAGFQVGGQPAAAWFGRDPLTAPHADVDAETAALVSSWSAPGLQAQPVEISEACAVKLSLQTQG